MSGLLAGVNPWQNIEGDLTVNNGNLVLGDDQKLVLDDDADTFISSPSDDQINFTSGNGVRFFISNSGLVTTVLIRPSSDDTNDIGEDSVPLRFRDQYLSGDIYLGGAQFIYLDDDEDTHVSSPSANLVNHTAGGVLAMQVANGTVWQRINGALTADVGSAQGGQPLTAGTNIVAVCENAGDSVTMPAAQAALGVLIYLQNDGANACDVFPASGDNLGAGVDTAVSLAAGANITRRNTDATNWVVPT